MKENARGAEGGGGGVRARFVPNAVGVWFGAQSARSEAPVRAAAERRPPGRGRSGREAVRTAEVCVRIECVHLVGMFTIREQLHMVCLSHLKQVALWTIS